MDVLRVVDGRIGQGHELVQHSKLELQSDAVDHGFQGGLDIIPVGVFHRQQRNVHGNDDKIDPDELHHHFSGSTMVDGSQEFEGGIDIDTRDDEFLDAKGRHLQALDHFIGDGIFVVEVGTGVGAIGEHGGGNVEAEGIDDDHGQNATQNLLLTHHEVQARVQHDGLAGDHAIPTDGDDGHG